MADRWIKKYLPEAQKYEFPFECVITRFVEELADNETEETNMLEIQFLENQEMMESVCIFIEDNMPFRAPRVYFMTENLVHSSITGDELLFPDWFPGMTLVQLVMHIWCVWKEGAANLLALEEDQGGKEEDQGGKEEDQKEQKK